eukprot:m.202909 g.202909  ORF g.202909 m.202909 type:complete len:312 (-) comp25255_c0_seq1:348-1283(-)
MYPCSTSTDRAASRKVGAAVSIELAITLDRTTSSGKIGTRKITPVSPPVSASDESCPRPKLSRVANSNRKTSFVVKKIPFPRLLMPSVVVEPRIPSRNIDASLADAVPHGLPWADAAAATAVEALFVCSCTIHSVNGLDMTWTATPDTTPAPKHWVTCLAVRTTAGCADAAEDRVAPVTEPRSMGGGRSCWKVPNMITLYGQPIRSAGTKPRHNARMPSARTVFCRQWNTLRYCAAPLVCNRVLTTSNGVPTSVHMTAVPLAATALRTTSGVVPMLPGSQRASALRITSESPRSMTVAVGGTAVSDRPFAP